MLEESKFLGVSVRAWIAIFLVLTVCVMCFLQREVKEPIYSLVLLVVGAYFGKMSNNTGNGGKNGNGTQ